MELFSFFHLNLAYSSIEEEQRPLVIERCYWPLLHLAGRHRVPFGIETSGYTLETIAALDPAWLAELRRLIEAGICELIGCGYAQIIGPLVPAEVNAANLRLGMQTYERLLGKRPDIALVNEQAYSAGIVALYRDAGYQAVIMEWNNPARAHPEWDPEWRYLPHYALGPDGEGLPLIWNKSIAFQKFQRYVHGELELEEYLDYLRAHLGVGQRAFPLYGNDAEIFDFRPGRYMTEAPLREEGEWRRIETLFLALGGEPGMRLIAPRQVLELLPQPGAGQRLRLECAAQPTPVKKQDKYNLLRWAVTGRDDLAINTRCWRLYEALRATDGATDADWRELCYLWGSDFRTHITGRRWEAYRQRLEAQLRRWPRRQTDAEHPLSTGVLTLPALRLERRGRFLEIQGQRLGVRLNCQRGLALDALTERGPDPRPLCGTLHHGYFDDIHWGADYYSGHLVFDSPGRPKVTDLNSLQPHVQAFQGGVRVSATIPTPLGDIEKIWRINDAEGRLELHYRLHWRELGLGSLRLGYITLVPESFEAGSLSYRTHNGGRSAENFSLAGGEVDQGRAVSFLVSASQALGLTEGWIELGDARHGLSVTLDKTEAALVGLMTHQRVGDRYFCRLAFSAREVDDTSREGALGPLSVTLTIRPGLGRVLNG